MGALVGTRSMGSKLEIASPPGSLFTPVSSVSTGSGVWRACSAPQVEPSTRAAAVHALSSKSVVVHAPGLSRASMTSGMELQASGDGRYSVELLDFHEASLRRISWPSASNKAVSPGAWLMMRPLVAPA